ncbi:MAG: cytochrome c-type biogenesis protein [Alcaligenaceae bacterium]
MSRLLAIIVLACSLGIAQSKEAELLAQDPIVVEQRLTVISEEMRCLVCQNESLAGSRADLALDLRREIRDLIRQGKTDAEIRTFMVERYGDFILYRPPVRTTTWLLWLGPFILLAFAVFALFRFFRLRNRQQKQVAATNIDVERLSALLKEPKK